MRLDAGKIGAALPMMPLHMVNPGLMQVSQPLPILNLSKPSLKTPPSR